MDGKMDVIDAAIVVVNREQTVLDYGVYFAVVHAFVRVNLPATALDSISGTISTKRTSSVHFNVNNGIKHCYWQEKVSENASTNTHCTHSAFA